MLNQRVGKFVLDSPGTKALGFLYCVTRQPTFKTQVEVKSHGTAQANVSSEGILSTEIIVPPKTVRDAFNGLCEEILEKILSNHAENSCISAQRDTLLPKLLSGEMRVSSKEGNSL